MSGPERRSVLAAVLMLLAAGLAMAMKPSERMADSRTGPGLESVIPLEFGEWKIDSSLGRAIVSPDVQEQLDKLYGETVSRVYVNSTGERIMLSAAYGGSQTKYLQVHRPEVCYVAQGFQIGAIARDQMTTGSGTIPITRLVAFKGPRNEPITYWITVGEDVVNGGLEQRLTAIRYGLSGKVPDGVLVRISSIGADAAGAYRVQDRFVNAMVAAVPPEHRSRLLGRASL